MEYLQIKLNEHRSNVEFENKNYTNRNEKEKNLKCVVSIKYMTIRFIDFFSGVNNLCGIIINQ